MKESEVLVCFNVEKMSREQREHLIEAKKHLAKAGITFDSGQGFGERHWEFDWSLKGPVTVYHKCFPEGGDEIAVESPD